MRHPALAVLALAAASQLLAGCPADCFPEVRLTVTIPESVALSSGMTLVVVDVPKIRADDVTGTDVQGIPEGNREHGASELITIVDPSVRSYESSFLASPYETWFYAFVETDGNLALDSGEAFGINILNPRDLGAGQGCNDYAGAIINLNRVRQ